MVDITILELHLDGAEFTANAPFTGGTEQSKAGGRFPFGGGDDAVDDAGDDEGRSLLPLFVAVGVVVLAALVGRRIVGGSGEPLE